ncbi:hypothetical protein A2U01_0066580, partial [Trifolium medium]|nr:hypothetical protein [Trifolium medium]
QGSKVYIEVLESVPRSHGHSIEDEYLTSPSDGWAI